jgi:hypothetical protein
MRAGPHAGCARRSETTLASITGGIWCGQLAGLEVRLPPATCIIGVCPMAGDTAMCTAPELKATLDLVVDTPHQVLMSVTGRGTSPCSPANSFSSCRWDP